MVRDKHHRHGAPREQKHQKHGSKLLAALFGDGINPEEDVENEDSLGKDQLAILDYSKNCIEESPSIRFLTMLYAERKFVFFFLVHFVCTMLVWQHFMYSKFRVTEASTPEGANRYWWKRMIPAMEFGSMHAILFQLAIIPMTMSRYTLTTLSKTYLNKVIPFNHMTSMHIHLGYTTILIVFLATITFFTFFGLLCEEQKKGIEPRPLGAFTFCDKFTEEIMNTGYGLIAILLILFFTSFFRQKIPYEVFYAVHHLVFGMFGLTIAHTFDDKFRDGSAQRSQTFKWFAATLLWYATDRIYMWSTRSAMRVTELIALGGETDDDEKAIILRVKKPVTFGYVPGQYASIRVSSIDMHWHPFSIGSEPSQPCLEFYMMVSTSSNKTWTAQLWDIAKAAKSPADLPFTTVDVLGPYGTCIDTSSHMHLCAIGGGTGIVSMLSTLKATVNLLCQINPRYHADAEAGLRESAKELVVQRKEISKSFRHMTRRSLSTKDSTTAVQPCDVEQALGGALEMTDKDDNCFETPDKSRSTSKNKSKTPPATRSKHTNMSGEKIRRGSSAGLTSSMTTNGSVNTDLLRTRMHKLWFKEVMKLFFLLAPVWELLMSGLTLSWHNETHPITEEMMYFLKAGTIVCVVNFGVIFLASFEALFFEAWVDILFVGISIFSTLWWCEHKSWGNFNHLQVCAFLGLSAYRGLRTWTVANSSLNDSIQSQVAKLGVSSLVSISSMELVWVCRDASLVEFLWPEIDTYWTKLKTTWGNRAGDVVTIKIYVTSTDGTARKRLERSLRDTALFETGALKFGRPDMFDIVQNQLLNRVKDDANAGGVSAASSTLVAFCGSPSLGSVVGREVMNVQIIAEATKHGHHTMTFYQENYGIAPTKKKNAYKEGEVGARMDAVKAFNEAVVTETEKGTTLEGANGHHKGSRAHEGRNDSELSRNGSGRHVYQSCQVREDGGNDDDDVSDDGIEINGIEIDLGLDDMLEDGANSKKQSPKSGMEFY